MIPARAYFVYTAHAVHIHTCTCTCTSIIILCAFITCGYIHTIAIYMCAYNDVHVVMFIFFLNQIDYIGHVYMAMLL